jgi:hypothetical protein
MHGVTQDGRLRGGRENMRPVHHNCRMPGQVVPRLPCLEPRRRLNARVTYEATRTAVRAWPTPPPHARTIQARGSSLRRRCCHADGRRPTRQGQMPLRDGPLAMIEGALRGGGQIPRRACVLQAMRRAHPVGSPTSCGPAFARNRCVRYSGRQPGRRGAGWIPHCWTAWQPPTAWGRRTGKPCSVRMIEDAVAGGWNRPDRKALMEWEDETR